MAVDKSVKSKKVIVKRPPKTIKEKRFVEEYLKTGNATEAASRVYDAKMRDTARNIGAQNVAKLSMADYFEAAGLTKEVMAANTTRIALTAKKQNQFTGEVDDDYVVQLRAMDFAAKLTSWAEPPRAPVDEEGNTVIPILGSLNVQRNDGDL